MYICSIVFSPQKNIKNVMIIGDKNNDEVKKVNILFQNHYFREKQQYFKNSIFFMIQNFHLLL